MHDLVLDIGDVHDNEREPRTAKHAEADHQAFVAGHAARVPRRKPNYLLLSHLEHLDVIVMGFELFIQDWAEHRVLLCFEYP